MSSANRSSARVTRTRWFPWLISAVIVAVLVAVIAALGGFAPAAADRGARTEAGQRVDTRNWQVVVEGAALVDGYGEDEVVVQVRVEVTNISDQTRTDPRRGLLDVEVAGQHSDEASWSAAGEREDGFDPLVPREAIVEFPAPAGIDASDVVTVVLRDEVVSWSYADGVETEALGDPVAHVELTLDDQRGRR